MKKFALIIVTLAAVTMPVKAFAVADDAQAIKDCKTLIATFLGDPTLASQIPTVANNGSKGEFLFGWPQGSFNLGNFRGSKGQSASCLGTFKKDMPSVESVTINGKSVL